MEELIRKYLSGELSERDQLKLQRWLARHPDKQVELTRLLSYLSDSEEDLSDVKRQVWEDVHFRINSEQNSPLTTQPVRNPIWRFCWSAAASVAIVIGVVMWMTQKDPAIAQPEAAPVSLEERIAQSGQKVSTVLPDGTKVLLNARSKIKYPSHFSVSSREVQLEGEAFFEVKHDPDRPFLVKFRGSQVAVLGTSFNIRTYGDERKVSVAVATGRVAFTSEQAQSEVMLDPHEMVSYDEESEEMIKRHFDPIEVFGWKDKILYFKDDSFEEIIKELESWYGVKIIAAGDFAGEGLFSGEFRNKSLESVLEGLSYLYEFTFDINGKEVTLTQ